MNSKPHSIASPERLHALQTSGLLSDSFEPALDRLTRLVTAALRVPVSLISLVDKDRQYFKSYCGLPEALAAERETPLSHSFCQHVVVSQEPLLITDARLDPRVSDNLAVPDIGVIAYAGVPIVDEHSFVLGSLCAIDFKPRQWSPEDIELLYALSSQISVELELQSRSHRLAKELERRSLIEADRQEMIRLNVHDLRTPLSAMLLGMDALRLLGPLSERQTEFLLICKRSGRSLMEMVNSMIDIGSIDQRGSAALNTAACDPREVLLAAVDQVQILAVEKSIDLQVQLPRRLPMITADIDKLVRVMVNLLGNAIKFTESAGRVEIAALADADAGEVIFLVRDTGIGIADGSRIFEEGVRVNDTAPSTRSAGLGLTFCKRIVEAHGGRIWFDSQPGVGSCFQVAIPATVPVEARGGRLLTASSD